MTFVVIGTLRASLPQWRAITHKCFWLTKSMILHISKEKCVPLGLSISGERSRAIRPFCYYVHVEVFLINTLFIFG